MSLEVKTYREIRAYRSKILFGLSARQLVLLAVFLPPAVGIYLLCLFLGVEMVGVYAVFFLMLPAACLGWVRPYGLCFEHFARLWWGFYTAPKTGVFAAPGVGEDRAGAARAKVKAVSRKTRKGRSIYGVWEASN